MTLLGKNKSADLPTAINANLILIGSNIEHLLKEVHELKVILSDHLALTRKQVEVNATLTGTLDKFLVIQNRIALEEAKRKAAREEELLETEADKRF